MIKHGDSYSRLYRIWAGMKQRCFNPNCSIYHKYGAKGITVCGEWKDRYVNFKEWAERNGYTDNLTIDRIDNNKGYNPENCRWATYETQNTNVSKLKTNSSGYTGVSWAKVDKRWLCNISINNKSVMIGAYKTQKEAVSSRNKYIQAHLLPHKMNKYVGELC